jgi:hypothetical protein
MASTSEETTAPTHENDSALLQRQRRMSQAFDEGHDADIPSGEGYILDAEGEKKRRASIAEKRRKSDATREVSTAGSIAERDTDIEKAGAGVENPVNKDSDDDDPNVVWWDDNDPEHPYNWPRWRTLTNIVLISAMTFLTPLASCKISALNIESRTSGILTMS